MSFCMQVSVGLGEQDVAAWMPVLKALRIQIRNDGFKISKAFDERSGIIWARKAGSRAHE